MKSMTTPARFSDAPATPELISVRPYGVMPDGVQAELYTLRNGRGMEVEITNYGGIVVSLKVPDRNGKLDDVTLGYGSLEGYLKDTSYFGALVGRCANRVANARFELEGRECKLAANDGCHTLHGGAVGFSRRVWRAEPRVTAGEPELHLHYTSPDGEDGFPGNLSIDAVYTLTRGNELRLDYSATTDKTTVANLTQHSYYNLAGEGAGDILGHEVTINADAITPIDGTLIPTGELRPVEGTPFDFRKAVGIGKRIGEDDDQLKLGRGYDHNWVIKKAPGELAFHASVYEPGSGRVLEVLSTSPGLQFYTGNFLDGTAIGKRGKPYEFRHGLALEPQFFPDSPNQPKFPSAALRPGETFTQTIIHRFSVR